MDSRRVDLGRGVVVELAMVAPSSGSFAIAIDSDTTSLVLELEAARNTDGEHVLDWWQVGEAELADALEGAVRIGAIAAGVVVMRPGAVNRVVRAVAAEAGKGWGPGARFPAPCQNAIIIARMVADWPEPADREDLIRLLLADRVAG